MKTSFGFSFGDRLLQMLDSPHLCAECFPWFFIAISPARGENPALAPSIRFLSMLEIHATSWCFVHWLNPSPIHLQRRYEQVRFWYSVIDNRCWWSFKSTPWVQRLFSTPYLREIIRLAFVSYVQECLILSSRYQNSRYKKSRPQSKVVIALVYNVGSRGDHWAKIVEQCAIKNRVQYIHCR